MSLSMSLLMVAGSFRRIVITKVNYLLSLNSLCIVVSILF